MSAPAIDTYLEERKPGHLNPTWVEWLMGYPEDYTLIEEE